MRVIKNSLLVLIAISLSACASIYSKSEYGVSFRSTPSDAKIVIYDRRGDEILNDVTPCKVYLKASSSYFTPERYIAQISFEGYQTSTVLIRCLLDEWYFTNALGSAYGLLGLLIIDPATGAMYKVEKRYYSTVLHKLNLAEPTISKSTGKSITVINYQELGSDVRQYLTLAAPALD